MTIIPSGGIIASVAGTSLAQTAGTEPIRAQQDANVQQRKLESALRAEATAGIARTDGEDQEASDRDADGRLPWHLNPHASQAIAQEVDDPAGIEHDPHADDATGQHLDLIG